jgi:hypothetical protein
VLGGAVSVRTAVIVGGMDVVAQALELGRRPHVVVATPGRLVDLLKSSSGEWDLSRVKFLVREHSGARSSGRVTEQRHRSWMKQIDCSRRRSHLS